MITLRTGKLGVGKSYAATWEVWKTINKGKNAYVNWDVDFTQYAYHKARSPLTWIKKAASFLMASDVTPGNVYRFEGLSELYHLRNGEVFYDEAHAELNARDWKTIPKDFIKKLTQARKYGLNLHFITQHQMQVDTVVRRLCNEMVVHRKWGPFFYWKYYEAEKMDAIANPMAPQPPSDGMGFTIFNKKFAQSYDSFGLFGDVFTEFEKPPSWSYENLKAFIAEKHANARGIKRWILVLFGFLKRSQNPTHIKALLHNWTTQGRTPAALRYRQIKRNSPNLPAGLNSHE